jgi:hypothetical protein
MIPVSLQRFSIHRFSVKKHSSIYDVGVLVFKKKVFKVIEAASWHVDPSTHAADKEAAEGLQQLPSVVASGSWKETDDAKLNMLIQSITEIKSLLEKLKSSFGGTFHILPPLTKSHNKKGTGTQDRFLELRETKPFSLPK